MTTCSICGRNEQENNMFVFYRSEKRGEDVQCCEWCDQQLLKLKKSKDEAEIKEALNYVEQCMDTISDEEVKIALKERVLAAGNKEKWKSKDKKENDGSAATFNWIIILKVCAWVQFITDILAGLALMELIGFAAVLLGLAVGMVLLALNMVLIGAAEDIRAIRNKLTKA